MRKRVVLFANIAIALTVAHGGTLQESISSVLEFSTPLGCPALYVKDWNFPPVVYENAIFKTAVATVSNSWQSITNEWPAIRDDFDRRVIFRNMIGFAGTNAFLNIVSYVADDAQTNVLSRTIFADMITAPRTPLWMYSVDNFTDTTISNLFAKMAPLYEDSDNKMFFRMVLSGEFKRELDEMRLGGAVEY